MFQAEIKINSQFLLTTQKLVLCIAIENQENLFRHFRRTLFLLIRKLQLVQVSKFTMARLVVIQMYRLEDHHTLRKVFLVKDHLPAEQV